MSFQYVSVVITYEVSDCKYVQGRHACVWTDEGITHALQSNVRKCRKMGRPAYCRPRTAAISGTVPAGGVTIVSITIECRVHGIRITNETDEVKIVIDIS